MNHKGTVKLETERLLLRRFIIDDAEAIFRNYYSDPDAVRFSRWEPHKNVDTTNELVSKFITDYESPDSYNWVIVLKKSDGTNWQDLGRRLFRYA